MVTLFVGPLSLFVSTTARADWEDNNTGGSAGQYQVCIRNSNTGWNVAYRWRACLGNTCTLWANRTLFNNTSVTLQSLKPRFEVRFKTGTGGAGILKTYTVYGTRGSCVGGANAYIGFRPGSREFIRLFSNTGGEPSNRTGSKYQICLRNDVPGWNVAYSWRTCVGSNCTSWKNHKLNSRARTRITSDNFVFNVRFKTGTYGSGIIKTYKVYGTKADCQGDANAFFGFLPGSSTFIRLYRQSGPEAFVASGYSSNVSATPTNVGTAGGGGYFVCVRNRAMGWKVSFEWRTCTTTGVCDFWKPRTLISGGFLTLRGNNIKHQIKFRTGSGGGGITKSYDVWGTPGFCRGSANVYIGFRDAGRNFLRLYH